MINKYKIQGSPRGNDALRYPLNSTLVVVKIAFTKSNQEQNYLRISPNHHNIIQIVHQK